MTQNIIEKAEAPPPAIESASVQQSLLPAVIALAKDPEVNVEKLEALLRMQERMEARRAEAEFSAAFARLSGRLPRVKKDGTVTLIKDGRDLGSYKFARWEDIDRIIRPLLSEEGFGLSFNSRPRGQDGGGLIVTGILMHRDGHSISAEMPLPLDTGAGRNNLQATGSTLSYGKRYVAEMLLNIVRESDDDDGVIGGTEYIDDDKIRQINDLIRETKADITRFLKFMGVDGIPKITVRDFPRAVAQLERKKREIDAVGRK